jgi:hypothetical protein
MKTWIEGRAGQGRGGDESPRDVLGVSFVFPGMFLRG